MEEEVLVQQVVAAEHKPINPWMVEAQESVPRMKASTAS